MYAYEKVETKQSAFKRLIPTIYLYGWVDTAIYANLI